MENVCPYCGNNMIHGVLSGDGRSGLYWNKGEKANSFIDKIGGSGKVMAVKYKPSELLPASFNVEAEYCSSCKKMIIDTEISK